MQALTPLAMNSASVGTMAGLMMSYILPGEHTWLKTVLSGFVGHLFFTLLQTFPSFRDVIKWYARKPSAVYISAEGPIYGKLETYIVNKYIKQIRACELQPRNGEIQYSIDRVQFHRPLLDQFEGKEIQLRLLRANGSTEITAESFRSMFYLFDMLDSAGTETVEKGANGCAVIVSSWILNVSELRAYIDKLCEFQSEAKVVAIYVPKIVGYEGKTRKDEDKASRTAIVEWDSIHVKSNTRLCNTILSANVQETLVNDVKVFMNSEAWYNDKGMPYKRGWVLIGPPGTGKTSVIKALAAEYKLPVFTVDFGIVTTNMQFTGLMKEINHHTNNKPYIVAFEDFDRCKLFDDRGYRDYDEDRRGISISCLLNEIDGLVESHGRLLFITANDDKKLKKFDKKALMRPGRVDQTVTIDYCDFDQVQRLLFHFYGLDDAIAELKAAELNGKYSAASIVGLLQKHVRNSPPDKVIRMLFGREKDKKDSAGLTEALEPCAVRKTSPLTKAQERLAKSRLLKRRAVRDLKYARRSVKQRQKDIDNKDKIWLRYERRLAEAKLKVVKTVELVAKRTELHTKFLARVKQTEKVEKAKQKARDAAAAKAQSGRAKSEVNSANEKKNALLSQCSESVEDKHDVEDIKPYPVEQAETLDCLRRRPLNVSGETSPQREVPFIRRSQRRSGRRRRRVTRYTS